MGYAKAAWICRDPVCAGVSRVYLARQPNARRRIFGPNVFVFNPAMPATEVQQQIDKVYAISAAQ